MLWESCSKYDVPHYVCENIDVKSVITVQKNNFGFHGNKKTQGHRHQLNN